MGADDSQSEMTVLDCPARCLIGWSQPVCTSRVGRHQDRAASSRLLAWLLALTYCTWRPPLAAAPCHSVEFTERVTARMIGVVERVLPQGTLHLAVEPQGLPPCVHHIGALLFKSGRAVLGSACEQGSPP